MLGSCSISRRASIFSKRFGDPSITVDPPRLLVPTREVHRHVVIEVEDALARAEIHARPQWIEGRGGRKTRLGPGLPSGPERELRVGPGVCVHATDPPRTD